MTLREYLKRVKNEKTFCLKTFDPPVIYTCIRWLHLLSKKTHCISHSPISSSSTWLLRVQNKFIISLIIRLFLPIIAILILLIHSCLTTYPSDIKNFHILIRISKHIDLSTSIESSCFGQIKRVSQRITNDIREKEEKKVISHACTYAVYSKTIEKAIHIIYYLEGTNIRRRIL